MHEFLEETFKFLSKFKKSKLQEENFEEFRKIYRQRTNKEIVSSGYFLACYEPAVILYEKAEERGIPARFIEMIDIKNTWFFISDDGTEIVENIWSHCFVELELDGEWVVVDPDLRETLSKYSPRYIFFSEGPHKWKSFDEFREAQKRFILKTSREIKGKIFIYESESS